MYSETDYEVGDTVRILWNGEKYDVIIEAFLGHDRSGDHYLVSSVRFMDGAMISSGQILEFLY
jgi:hypothetical protein